MIQARNLSASVSARPRSGYSLIEMLVVISISVVLLSLMYRAIVSVMRRTSEPDVSLTRFDAMARCGANLRADLRAAESFRIGEDGASLECVVAGDRMIDWRIATRPFRLERLEAGNSKPIVFGLYGFGAGHFERFEISGGKVPMVRLTLEPERSRRSPGVVAGPAPFEMEFAAGPAKPAEPPTGAANEEAKP